MKIKRSLFSILLVVFLLLGIFVSNYHYFINTFRWHVFGPEIPPYHKLWIRTLAFSPDSKEILVGYLSPVYPLMRIYNIDTGDVVYEFPGKTSEAFGSQIAFSAYFSDGKRFLIGSGSYFKIFDAETKEVLLTVESPYGIHFTSVSLTPLDENILTMYNDGPAVLWDAKTGEKLREFSEIYGLGRAFLSYDEKFLLAPSAMRTAAVWDFASEQKIHSIQNAWCFGEGFFSPFSPNNEMFTTVSCENPKQTNFWRANIWDVSSAKLISSIPTKAAATTAIFSADSQSILIGWSRGLVFYDILSASPKITFTISDHICGEAALSPDETLVASAMIGGDVKIWDAKTGEEIKILNLPMPKEEILGYHEP